MRAGFAEADAMRFAVKHGTHEYMDGFGDESKDAALPEVDESQLVERLSWTPRQRLDYLLDMLAFEERAATARRID
jgi:hypothetical protein